MGFAWMETSPPGPFSIHGEGVQAGHDVGNTANDIRVEQGLRRVERGGWQRTRRGRRVRVFAGRLAVILAELLGGEVRTGRFVPEPWPGVARIPRVSEADFDAREYTDP